VKHIAVAALEDHAVGQAQRHQHALDICRRGEDVQLVHESRRRSLAGVHSVEGLQELPVHALAIQQRLGRVLDPQRGLD